jgi:hypothetical protein
MLTCGWAELNTTLCGTLLSAVDSTAGHGRSHNRLPTWPESLRLP